MSGPDQESESNDFHNAIPEVDVAASLTKRQRNRRRCKLRAGFSKVPLRNGNDSQISEGGKGIFQFDVDTQIFQPETSEPIERLTSDSSHTIAFPPGLGRDATSLLMSSAKPEANTVNKLYDLH